MKKKKTKHNNRKAKSRDILKDILSGRLKFNWSNQIDITELRLKNYL